MRLNRFLTAGASLAVVLAFGGHAAEAGQRDSHGRDRNGRASQGQNQQRQSGAQQPQQQPPSQQQQQESVTAAPRSQAAQRQAVPAPAPANTVQRHYAVPRPVAPAVRGYAPATARSPRINRTTTLIRIRRTYGYLGASCVMVYAPRASSSPSTRYRTITGRAVTSASTSGGVTAICMAPWTGPVYGQVAPTASTGQQPVYYGDVRLLVQPRNAEVYVRRLLCRHRGRFRRNVPAPDDRGRSAPHRAVSRARRRIAGLRCLRQCVANGRHSR